MTQTTKAGTSVLVGIILGAAGSALVFFNWDRGDANSTADANASDQGMPLYWVAPMDADYRRDKPGKSPGHGSAAGVCNTKRRCRHGAGHHRDIAGSG